MTTDRPTTHRAGLLALADQLERDGLTAGPGELRALADCYPDPPEAVTLDATEEATIRWSYGDEALAIRVEALRAAATTWQGVDSVTDEGVVLSAIAFEAYLRGDQ